MSFTFILRLLFCGDARSNYGSCTSIDPFINFIYMVAGTQHALPTQFYRVLLEIEVFIIEVFIIFIHIILFEILDVNYFSFVLVLVDLFLEAPGFNMFIDYTNTA